MTDLLILLSRSALLCFSQPPFHRVDQGVQVWRGALRAYLPLRALHTHWARGAFNASLTRLSDPHPVQVPVRHAPVVILVVHHGVHAPSLILQIFRHLSLGVNKPLGRKHVAGW